MAEICSVCLVNRTDFSFHDYDPDDEEKDYIRHMVCVSCFNNAIRNLATYDHLRCLVCGGDTPHGGWTNELKESKKN